MNETLNVLLNRRSIRKYKSEQIPEELMEQLLQAGLFAPSGGNCQYTHFTVIQSPEALAKLREIVETEFRQMEITEGLYKSKVHAIQMAKRGNYDFIYSAPALIIVTNRKGHGNAMADSAAAIENILIAAEALGLGGCWINQLTWISDSALLRKTLRTFGIGDDEVICGSIALGYSDQPVANAQPRLDGRVRRIR